MIYFIYSGSKKQQQQKYNKNETTKKQKTMGLFFFLQFLPFFPFSENEYNCSETAPKLLGKCSCREKLKVALLKYGAPVI